VKDKMAELFGVKTVQKPAVEEEINTLDIGTSRRTRRMATKKEESDSQNRSIKVDTNPPEEGGSVISVIDDFQEVTSKSRMRPPLSKKGVVPNPPSKGKPQDSLNHSRNDLEVSPPNEA
jgi:hypothetical protein